MSALVGESGKRNSGLGLRTSPAGYGFDYINADGLIHMLSAAEGRITNQGGLNTICSPWIRTANTFHCR